MKGRRGEGETQVIVSPGSGATPFLPFSLSPFLPFSLSPFLPFSPSPLLPFSLSLELDLSTSIYVAKSCLRSPDHLHSDAVRLSAARTCTRTRDGVDDWESVS